MAKSICISRDLYHVVRNDFVQPVLERWDFRQPRKEYFFRVDGDVVWRIITSFRRDGSRDQGMMDVYLGVGFHSLQRVLIGFPPLAEILASDRKYPCMKAIGILNLLPDGGNWENYFITPSTDPEEFASVVTADLESAGMQWFDDYGTLGKCISWWGHVETMWTRHEDWYLAAGYWVRGEFERAIELATQRRDETAVKAARAASFRSRDPSYPREAAYAQHFYGWLIQQPRSAPPQS